MYSSQVRSNMRYRGPIESRKLNKNNAEIYVNLSALYSKLEQMASSAQLLRDTIRYGSDTVAGEESTQAALRFLSIEAEAIKGGVKNV